MAELKQTEDNVVGYINSLGFDDQKRQDSLELLKLMEESTGFEAKMWGTSIIGFGSYHYRSERSRQEGDWPLAGFSPRKAAISLYVYTGLEEHASTLRSCGH